MLKALGDTLREAREARGLTLEDVEKSTRIRVRYLAALEDGDLGALPTDVQARGFLRNYARHVGLDPSATMAQLEAALNSSRRRSLRALFRRNKAHGNGTTPALENGVAPEPLPKALPANPAQFAQSVAPRISRWRRLRHLITIDAVIVVALFLGIVAFFIWSGTRVATAVLAQPEITATPQVIGPTATPTLITKITFTPSAPPPLANFSDVQLELLAEQRAFVRVQVDGEPQFDGLLAPGERLAYSGAQSVEVITGNGAGVRVILNGTDFGLLGSFGEVVARIYQPNGWITPTASTTPTPSETPLATETPAAGEAAAESG